MMFPALGGLGLKDQLKDWCENDEQTGNKCRLGGCRISKGLPFALEILQIIILPKIAPRFAVRPSILWTSERQMGIR